MIRNLRAECGCGQSCEFETTNPTASWTKAHRSQLDVWIGTHRMTTSHAHYEKIETTFEKVDAVQPDPNQLELSDDPGWGTITLGGEA